MSSILAPMRFGEFGSARVDHAGDVADAPVERADHFLAAVGHRLGHVFDPGGEVVVEHLGAGGKVLVERLGAAVERVLEANELLVEARGDLRGLDGDAGVEIVQVVAHRAVIISCVRSARRSTISPP